MPRLPNHAIGNAAVTVLAHMQEQGFQSDTISWGDCTLLDEIARMSGFHAMHPMHPLNRHHRILNALDRDARFEKFLFRCVDSNGLREIYVRAFRLKSTE